MKKIAAILVFGWVMGTAGGAWAQTAGVVEGVVRDASQAAVQNCTVTLTGTTTNLKRTVAADGEGRYVAAGLPPGAYRVEASAEGFRTAVRQVEWLSPGRTQRVDFELVVGELREVLEVAEDLPVVSTSSADWGGTVEQKQLANLPLNGRDLFDLAAQQPGIAIANNNEGAMYNGLGVQPAVNGNRPNQNAFRLDGLYLNDASGSAPASAGGRLLGVESIEELRLIANPFSAEYGRAASGVFTAVSRAGGNEWHGSLYHFLRNDALDARNYFDVPGEKQPSLRRNQAGGLLSGPLRANRAFFLVNYEDLRESRGRTQRATTITAAARDGRLPDRQIQVNPLVRPFLELYPLPNGDDFGDGTGEFVSTAATRADDHFFATRGDFLLNDGLRTSVRYSSNQASTAAPDTFLFWNFASDSHFHFLHSETTFVQSAATLHAFRFGYSRVRNTEDATQPAEAQGLTFVRGRPLGTIEVTGLSDLTTGTVSALPRNHLLQNGQFNYDLTHTRGGHTFRAGAGYDRLSFRQLGDFRASGRYRFTSLQSLLEGVSRGADLMTPDSDTSRLWRQNQYFFFAQDEWRARPGLSLTLGVRYEGYTPPSEADGKIATLRDPLRDTGLTIGGPLFANPSKANFAPRAALAWDVFGSGRTVVRAGAGMFFDLLTSREVTIAGMRVPPFFNRAFIDNPTFPDMLAALANARVDNSMDGLAYHLEQPYVMQYRFAVEQDLGKRTSLEVGYSGSRGAHLIGQFGDVNVAQAQMVDGRLFFPSSAPLRNPALGRIGLRSSDFNSFYHAFTLRLQRRLSQGVQFQTSYTWAKAIDESSSSTQTDFDNSDRMPQPYNIREQRGRADFDVRHTLNANAAWTLPSPRAGWSRHLAGGWEVLGLVQMQTGFPFNPRVGFDRARMRSGFGDLDQRPNLAAAGPPVILGDPGRYFDPLAFALPEAGFLGNLGRNTLSGPGLFSLNAAMHKALWRSERQEIRFRFETFNLTNRPNFDGPWELRLFASSGGRVGSAGRIISTSTPSRQIQVAVRWVF